MGRSLLNPSEAGKYPNLRQVLQERARALDHFPPDPAAFTVLAVLGVVILIAILPGLLLKFAALPFLFAPAWLWRRLQSRKMPDLEIRKDHLEVLRRMSMCIEKNRLEHDLTTANAELLEGCATAYLHARAALDRWDPVYGQEMKRRLDLGVCDAMDEAILAHRDALPKDPTSLPAGVQLGKLADTFLFGKGAQMSGPLEPAFSRTRMLADELRDAAHTVEEAARQLTGTTPPPIKTPSLRDALGDLKMIQQAEDELRQDLRGGA